VRVDKSGLVLKGLAPGGLRDAAAWFCAPPHRRRRSAVARISGLVVTLSWRAPQAVGASSSRLRLGAIADHVRHGHQRCPASGLRCACASAAPRLRARRRRRHAAPAATSIRGRLRDPRDRAAGDDADAGARRAAVELGDDAAGGWSRPPRWCWGCGCPSPARRLHRRRRRRPAIAPRTRSAGRGDRALARRRRRVSRPRPATPTRSTRCSCAPCTSWPASAWCR
jgi:hypothetical protein